MLDHHWGMSFNFLRVREVPPTGFRKPPAITFSTFDSLATASTCDLLLRLQLVITDEDDFVDKFTLECARSRGLCINTIFKKAPHY